jgi:RNA polymerase sigma-70 factor (ECF subfamily)
MRRTVTIPSRAASAEAAAAASTTGDNVLPAQPTPPLTQADIDFVKKALRDLGVRAEADLDDVTGIVLLDLVRTFDKYNPLRPLRPWLYGFARNRAFAYRRRRKVRAHREAPFPHQEALEPVAGGADPHEHAEARERLATLDALLDELAPEEAQVLLLYEGTAMELADVAAVLDVPYGTAASRLFFARKHLHAARARLKARLAHRGETWAALPPLALLLGSTEAWPDDAAAPPGMHDASAVPPRRGAPARWMAGSAAAALASLSALAVAAVLFARCDAPAPVPVPTVEAIAAPETAPAPLLETPEPAPTPGAAPPPPVSAAPPATPRAPPRDDLSPEEVKAQIYAARMSFARGDALGALAVLDRLARRDRRGLFADDRELLRVEVLARVGRLAEARTRLGRLRRAKPDDPRVRRLDRVLGASP